MATMKTANELFRLSSLIDKLESAHFFSTLPSHFGCTAAICLKCGQAVYSCQPEWQDRQCPCDAGEGARR